MFVFAGNWAALDAPDGDGARGVLDGKRRVEVVYPDGHTLGDAFKDFTAPGGVWDAHSAADAPAWVASDSPGLALLLGEHYGCEVRDPLPAGEAGEHAARVHHFTSGSAA